MNIILGPAPCHDCHARLYYVGHRWMELHYAKDGRRHWMAHRCAL